MDASDLQNLLRSRLGEAYTPALAARVVEVQQSVFAGRLELFRRAQGGEIDGRTFADEMNLLAASAIRRLRSILGDRFEDVFGRGVNENFALVDPDTAQRIDYTKIDPDALLTMPRITEALREPARLDALTLLAEQPLTPAELAMRLGVTEDVLSMHIEALKHHQLITGGESLSASWRVATVRDQYGHPSLLISDDGGEQQIFWLSRADVAAPEELARHLTGDWEYTCEATSSEHFSGHELGRGGIMRIVAVAHSHGVDASITATRLWYMAPDRSLHTLESPVEWKSEGGISVSNGRMMFRYTIQDEFGVTTDEYPVLDSSPDVLRGTFVHLRTDRRRITGVIAIRKMLDPLDLRWAPDGTIIVA